MKIVRICTALLCAALTLIALQGSTSAAETEEKAVRVTFADGYTEGMEQAVITGYDSADQELWQVQTESYPGTQLSRCSELGIAAGKYCYVENGTVIALSLEDGSRVWENSEFGGASANCAISEDGTLYICGYYRPDLFVVNADGQTIHKTEMFREGYNWPWRMELGADVLTIWYEQNGQSLTIRLSDFSIVDGEAVGSAEPEDGVRLIPTAITASSELEPYYSALPPYPLYTYYASYIDDGDLSTAWNEGVPGSGIGEYLDLAFPEGTVLTGGVIWPGFYETEELFYQNNAPTKLEIASGGESVVVDMGEAALTWQQGFSGLSFQLDTEIVSDGNVRVTILDVREGNTYDDACISELHFTGRTVTTDDLHEIKDLAGAEVGDIVPFGSNLVNTEEQTPLYWLVLDKQEEGLLLISRDVLPAPGYSENNYYPVWSESGMRTWLNGTWFQTVFSEEEKGMIRESDVTFTTRPQEDGTWGAETVRDKVFLLDAAGADAYFSSDEARKAGPIAGAGDMDGVAEGCAAWWLIGVGFESQGVAQVTAQGEIDTYGIGVQHLLGVRPVIRVMP